MGETRCTRPPRGWWCSRGDHDGPCAARPKWWNLRGLWQAKGWRR